MTERQKHKNIYWAWKSMKQRCQNPKCAAYKNYGARGIKVCDEWQKFEPFLEWCLANGHAKGLDLDRINNDGNYEPGNCRWTTRKENSNNTRFTAIVTVDGVEKCASKWEDEFDLPKGTVTYWIRNHGIEYAASRIKEVKEHGYTRHDYGYSHRKKIIHESGKIFDSVRECSKEFGLPTYTIGNAIRAGKKTKKGLFMYV